MLFNKKICHKKYKKPHNKLNLKLQSQNLLKICLNADLQIVLAFSQIQSISNKKKNKPIYGGCNICLNPKVMDLIRPCIW
ncbi:hypothetical protein XELAEV_18014556mg [Xenopus laevis]|uniref:Uncharacterized protein n=1 Tax=Xenopus laevis TaxID=8355 RepID=A0A974HVJ0_XENLA|nr:hypothetical protein XELAEV_18014556mg [Xenopus laevis]